MNHELTHFDRLLLDAARAAESEQTRTIPWRLIFQRYVYRELGAETWSGLTREAQRLRSVAVFERLKDLARRGWLEEVTETASAGACDYRIRSLLEIIAWNARA